MAFLTLLKFDRGRIENRGGQPRRVTALGGANFGVGWIHSIDEVIANIESGKHCYACQQGGQAVMVRVGVGPGGSKYLKAHTDMEDGEAKVLMALPLTWGEDGQNTKPLILPTGARNMEDLSANCS